MNNADRKGGHCLLGEDGEIWMIDHGVCFAAEPKLRTVIWDFIGEPLPSEVVGRPRPHGSRPELGRRAPSPAGRRSSQPEEVEATRERTAALLAAGVFPEPDPTTRPFPWPPI